jgi:hypothetical protein
LLNKGGRQRTGRAGPTLRLLQSVDASDLLLAPKRFRPVAYMPNSDLTRLTTRVDGMRAFTI